MRWPRPMRFMRPAESSSDRARLPLMWPLATGPITDRELAVAKGHIKGSLALSLEDSAGRMNRIGRSQLIHGDVLGFDETVARTEAVTHDDLRRVADRILGNERVLAVV